MNKMPKINFRSNPDEFSKYHKMKDTEKNNRYFMKTKYLLASHDGQFHTLEGGNNSTRTKTEINVIDSLKNHSRQPSQNIR